MCTKIKFFNKITQINKPIRPLINARTAPNYKIWKLLTQILKHKIELPAKHNIKNSIELTEQLINVKVNRNTKLYSFDISNMYTNIPIEETIYIIINNLKTNNESNTYIKQLTNTLKVILNQNYFQYNNNCLLYTSRCV